MRYHCWWVLAAAIAVQACAKPDHVVQTPPAITVLTPTLDVAPGDRPAAPAERARLTGNPTVLDPVVRVSSRLIAAARRSEYGERARILRWVIAVYEDPAPRAFVEPNGRITVNTGTFGLLETEAGLAALLAHELVHALGCQTPRFSTCVSLDANGSPRFTYQEELQADEDTLQLIADAGYDPRELLRLWERMRLTEKGRDEVLQHVIYDRRIEHIAQRLPAALIRYERANRAPQKALRQ